MVLMMMLIMKMMPTMMLIMMMMLITILMMVVMMVKLQLLTIFETVLGMHLLLGQLGQSQWIKDVQATYIALFHPVVSFCCCNTKKALSRDKIAEMIKENVCFQVAATR